MRHFGEPLVDNVFDFGLRTPPPVHQDLLDWLAAEFMQHNWSIKFLHRSILTSRTWQLASSVTTDGSSNLSIDPDNELLWRANTKRLDAECVRDSILSVAGILDTKMGGPVVAFGQADTSTRRSLYIQHANEKQATMMMLFDTASPNECYRRSQSIVPQQALAMANSETALRSARLLAGKLLKESTDSDSQFIELAFLHLLSRPPSNAERSTCQQFLEQQASVLSGESAGSTQQAKGLPGSSPSTEPGIRVKENLIHVLMNHNDFVTVR